MVCMCVLVCLLTIPEGHACLAPAHTDKNNRYNGLAANNCNIYSCVL